MSTAKPYIVIVSDNTLLALVSHEANVPSKFFRYLAGVAAFAQEGVHSPDFTPALFQGHFGKVRGRFPAIPIVELDLDSMCSHLWVRTGLCISSDTVIPIAKMFPAELFTFAH